MRPITITLLTTLLLAACAPGAVQPPPKAAATAVIPAEATAVPSPITPTAQPTGAPTPTPTPAAIIPAGQNPDGAFYRGDPHAPVTLIEYSDFL